MSTKKIKDIQNLKAVSKGYNAFIENIEGPTVSDNWDDENVLELIKKEHDDSEYVTDKLVNEIYSARLFCARYVNAHKAYDESFNPVAMYMALTRLIEKKIRHCGNVIAISSVNAIVRGGGADSYIIDLALGRRPQDMKDLADVAYVELMREYMSCRPAFSMNAMVEKTVRRHNVVAWNHEPNASDYVKKEKTLYRWARSACSEYIQKMRGVRVSVPERVYEDGTDEKGKPIKIERVKNNSVYYFDYRLNGDDGEGELLWRMKATNFNTGNNDSPKNEFMSRLIKELKAGKVITKKQLSFTLEYMAGDSYRTIAGAHGVHESTVRESVKSGMKKLEKWLIGHGYNVIIKGGKITLKTWE